MGFESAPDPDMERKVQEAALERSRQAHDQGAATEAKMENQFGRTLAEKLTGRNKQSGMEVLQAEAKDLNAARERERSDIATQMEQFVQSNMDATTERETERHTFEGVAKAEISPGAELEVAYEWKPGSDGYDRRPRRVELNGMDLNWGPDFLKGSMEIQWQTFLEAVRDYNDNRSKDIRGHTVDVATQGPVGFESARIREEREGK